MRILRRGKKGVAVILSVCLACTMLPWTAGTAASAEEAAGVQAASEPAQEVPEGYKPIRNGSDLYAIRDDLSAKYILMNDIDLSTDTAEGGDLDFGNGWEPIQNFKGELDGNGHRIIGMHIFGDMNGKDTGLFGSAYVSEGKGAVIHDLGMKDCEINVSNTDRVGAIAGSLYGCTSGSQSILNNCYTTGSINVSSKPEKYYWISLGGLVGYMYVDYNNSRENRGIQNCYNAASVSYAESDGTLGGIVGHVEDYNLTFSQCYNAGKVTQAENSYGNANTYAILGDTDSDYLRCDYKSCYYLADTVTAGGAEGRSNDSTGIKSYSDTQMKNQKLFTGFDFDDTWEFDPYCVDYPYPQLKSNRQVRATKLVITTMPSKVSYQQCDTEDFSDGKIEVTYENGVKTELLMTKAALSGYDMSEIGTQDVTVTYAGYEVTFPIEVRGVDVSAVALDQASIKLNVRQTQQLTASIAPENASNKSVLWESSDPSIATVSDTGLVQAVAKGKATITAYSYDKAKSASCEVEVLVPCVEVTLDQTELEMTLGESKTLIASMLPLETTDLVKWSSGNAAIVSVDEYGKITAAGAGTTTVTATADSGVQAVCQVTVIDPNATPTPDVSGDPTVSADPSASTNPVPSSNPAAPSGTTPVPTGATANQRVLTLNYTETTLDIGDRIALKVTYPNGDAAENDIFDWSSENTSVAVVSQSGSVRAKAPGTTTITATDPFGVYLPVTCKITVAGSTADSTETPASEEDIAAIKRVKVKVKKVSRIKKNSATLYLSCNDPDATGLYQIKVYYKGRAIQNHYTASCSKYKIKNLKKNRKYTVRVRYDGFINDDEYYGAWSAAKKFKTKRK